MKINHILKFKQNLFSKVIWSSTFKPVKGDNDKSLKFKGWLLLTQIRGNSFNDEGGESG